MSEVYPIKKDKLTISINTNGNSPSIAKELKIYIDKLLPKSLENFFIKMKNYRKKYPKGIKRQEKIRQKVKKYFSKLIKK